ncbi:DNA primase [Candidatus Peregrinibacteria bacterium]|nr:DNA primase [Candidatus Peregrinibacteria bacterium]
MFSTLDEIKARLSIEDVVSSYVPLKKIGSNYKALCPFHNEKTPSFVVSPEKQIAYCFGCHKGGDIFRFVCEIEHLDFKEAVKILAERAGVQVDHRSLPTHSKKEEERKNRLYTIMEMTTQFFSQQLFETSDGLKAQEYLSSRGISKESIRTFRLGFAPDSFDETHQYLFQKGFEKDDLFALGLIKSKDTTSERIYDTFRRRLIFPITDLRGKVIAFGARALQKGDEPKYLNSQETPIYHKSAVLYGLFYAKDSIKTEDKVLFVEGYMDCIASCQAGVCFVVASSGTALTRDQLRLIKRFTNNLYFAFDADDAGMQATNRAISLAQSMDFHIRIVHVPFGKDPAETVKEHVLLWQEAVSNAEPYLDFCFQTAFHDVDIKTQEGASKIKSSLFPVIKRIKDPLERDRCIKKLANMLFTEPKYVYDALEQYRDFNPSEALNVDESIGSSKEDLSPYEYFLGLIYQYPEYFPLVQNSLSFDHFLDPLNSLYKIYVNQYNTAAGLDREGFLSQLSEEEKQNINIFALKAEIRNTGLKREILQEEIKQVALWIRRKAMQFHRKKVLGRLKNAETETEEVFEEYYNLLKEHI